MASCISCSISTRAAALALAFGLLLTACDQPDKSESAVATPDEPFAGISNETLINAQEDPDFWVHYGRNYSANRYSPDTQINRENVGRLKPVWKYEATTGLAGFETTAIVFDDRIYITQGGNELIRLDPATGKAIWTYVTGTAKGPNRGAAVLGNRIYMGTKDSRLICVDADTGQLLWDRIVADPRSGHQLTAAPLVVDNKVIVGISGSNNGIRGFIEAFDAKTGKQAWRFWIVPGPGEPGSETWAGDSNLTGGGSAWLTGTYDPDLHVLYWGTAGPAPYFDGDARKGDNLFTNSIVALNPDTGELLWYFQTSPHDLFNYDGMTEPMLVEETFDGRPVEAIVQANRNGHLYVLDRTNGDLIRATPFSKVTWANYDANGKPVIKPELVNVKKRHVFPGLNGASNWPPKAYSPRTHMIYIPTIVRGTTFIDAEQEFQRGSLYLGGMTIWDEAPAEGTITAVDVPSGEIKWTFDTNGPNWGGLLATQGGLVFGGAFDGNLRAFNDETGEVLWEYQTGTAVFAPPTTFRIDGKQYIGLASGFSSVKNGSTGRKPQSSRAIYYLFGLEDD